MSEEVADEFIEFPSAQIPVTGHYDVVVAGAGLAGVAAATAAAQTGATTAIVEKQPFAGGISTAASEPSMCNYFHNCHHELVVRGRPLELVNRMVSLGALSPEWDEHRGHIIFDIELGKLAMDQMLQDAGVEILYDTIVTDAIMDGNCVEGLQIANRCGNQAILADCIVDATGDADVAAHAGADLHVGPQHSMPHSFLFRLGNVDLEAFAQYFRDNPDEYIHDTDIALTPDEALAFYEQTGRLQVMHHGPPKMQLIKDAIERDAYDKQWGPYKHMDAFQLHGIRSTNELNVNTGWFNLHEPDPHKISYHLQQGRKLAHHVAEFMKNTFPGCENSFVTSTANALGLRRTRWLNAEFTLTRDIYNRAPEFHDAVGRGVVINQRPLYTTDSTFDVPLRCLVPRNIDGIIVGSGRSASAAPAELLRTMPVTMIVGQGAGVTAAVAADTGVPPADIDVSSVQQRLKQQDVELG